MDQPIAASWRWLFALAACWNIGVGLAGLVAPERLIEDLYRPGEIASAPVMRLVWGDFSACVALFGIGYALVARDPRRNHGILLLGILGKLGVALTWSVRFFSGTATPTILLPVVIDLSFALAFIGFLVARRRAAG